MTMHGDDCELKSLTSRWPEEERGGGEAEHPELLHKISFDGSGVGLDGSRIGFDGSSVGLDGYSVSSVGSRVGLDGSRVSLDGSRGTQTDPDGQLEVIWMMSGETILVLVMNNSEDHLWLRLV